MNKVERVIFYLLVCSSCLLLGCGKKEKSLVEDFHKNASIQEETKEMENEEKKTNSGLAQNFHSPTLNAILMKMYEPIWREYEYAQNYGTYREEVWEDMGMDTYAIWRTAARKEGDRIYFSFVDINGDEVVEMLIGKDLASYMEEDITLLTVYYYDVHGKKVDNGGIVQDRSMLNLYEGGVLEIDYGEGFLTKLTYMTLWEEGWKQVEHIEERRERNIPKDAPRDADIVYLREGSGEEEREYITEEKYYAIQEEYANTPMLIEWKSFADTEGNQRMKEYFEAEALSPVIQKATEPYTELLINYDRVLHDPSYNRGDGTGWGIDENMVYDRVLRHVGKESNEVVYAIVDLAGDGEAELLIGEYWNDDGIYRPFIIYGNIQGKISPGLIAEEYLINLYKGGIIEVIAGKAMFEDFRYYKMKRNSADLENIVNLWGDRVDITSDEYIYYSDEVEISKEEFEDIRKELTNQPLEINWQPLQGFWQGE